ncbi:hypothetical protein JJD41_12225 [Oxynema sp. CENA135]|nr:hypothetical protein [Oxynema sp. CENA135]
MTFNTQIDINAQRRRQFITLVMKRVQPGTGSGLDFLNKRTWTYPVTDIKAIVTKTPFAIVGGIATRLYMPERMTLDLDILVCVRDAKTLYAELTKAGSQKIGELALPRSQWELPDGTSLDVLESNADWFPEAIATPNIAPNGLPIIALPYLVLMKLQSARTQDLSDVSRMMGAANPDEIAEVKQAISKYLPGALEDLESLIVLGQLERRPPGER